MKGTPKVGYVIRVRPDHAKLKELPEGLVKLLKESGKVQLKEFVIRVTPLGINEYRKLYASRYSLRTIVKVINECLEPIGVTVKYLLEFPLLLRGIVDLVFQLTGNELEEMAVNPDKLFKALDERRKLLHRVDALMDHLVLRNTNIETYLAYMNMKDLDDRLLLVAMIEEITGVIIRERYEFSKKTNTPIRLTPADRTYTKEFQKVMSKKGETIDVSMFEETSKLLKERIEQEKKYKELGIVRQVNTAQENRELQELG